MITQFSKVLILAVSMALSACVQMTVDAPGVCDSQPLGTVPASPVPVSNPPPLSYSQTFDFSDTVKKVNNVADSSNVTITQFVLTGDSDLGWVKEVTVTVGGQVFASYISGVHPQNSITMQVQMDSQTLTELLQHPINLLFTLRASSAPLVAVNFSANLCVDVSAQVNKSL